MDRRKFVKSSSILCGITLVGASTILQSCAKESTNVPQGATVDFTLDLNQSDNAPLLTPGGSLATQTVVVINLDGSYIALSQICTHNGCSVAYNDNRMHMECPCHGGTYDLQGNVISGPPPAPIKKYTVTKNGEILSIKG